MLLLKHKTFRAGPKFGFYWTERSLWRSRERIREQAEDYINAMGAEKVVSVTEEILREFLMVTVWYREEADSKNRPSEDVMDDL